MSYCISPLIQFFKDVFSNLVLRMVDINFLPKLDAEQPEIGSDTTGLSVLTVELATLRESSLDPMPYQYRRLDERHEMGNAFGMEIAAESLKMRSDQYGVRLIDLLSCVAASSTCPTHGGMSGLDLVQRIRMRRHPFPVRS